MSIKVQDWGITANGTPVHRILLRNGELSAAVITYGASIQDLRHAQHDAPLVLGFEELAAYESHALFFGCIVGRCANRVANGRFVLDDRQHALALRDGETHHLHGGPSGFSSRVWKIEEVADFEAVLVLESSHGEMGYPGALTARCIYRLTDENGLHIILEAQSDQSTICNLTNHSYFNLQDGGRSDVGTHQLLINADSICEVGPDLVPTGFLDDVSNTPHDFRALRTIGDEQAYDANFCLSGERRRLKEVAHAIAPTSGLEMSVATTEPGVQLYVGPQNDVKWTGLDGIRYGPRSAFCLETQVWPDAINHENFPDVVLKPGQILRQETVYQFSKSA